MSHHAEGLERTKSFCIARRSLPILPTLTATLRQRPVMAPGFGVSRRGILPHRGFQLVLRHTRGADPSTPSEGSSPAEHTERITECRPFCQTSMPCHRRVVAFVQRSSAWPRFLAIMRGLVARHGATQAKKLANLHLSHHRRIRDELADLLANCGDPAGR